MKTLIWLAYKQIVHRPLGAVLTCLLIALGVSLIAILLHAKQGYQERMEKTIKGVDMVIGAKGSPLQLVLSAVYHADVPTGNISLAEAKKFSKHPLVRTAIPLAYGDTYDGIRILGTEQSLFDLYKTEVEIGEGWKSPMDAVIGSLAAQRSELKLGSEFTGAHGLVQGGDIHEDHPFRVVGILNETGTVLDGLIFTSVESVHHVHEHEGDASDEITAMLIKFRNPVALMQLPRLVNEKTNMQAAVPRYEMERLYKVFGIGAEAINGLGLLIILVAALSMFIGMYNGLRERIPELALMRSYGATPPQLVRMLTIEGFYLGLFGGLLGLLLCRLFLVLINANWVAARSFMNTSWDILQEEVWILIVCMVLSVLVAMIPALRVVRHNLDSISDD